jgi:LysM repeat protein
VIAVVPGEDLQSVANRTGVSVSQLQAMNAGVDLKSVTKLVVPNGNVKLTRWTRSNSNSTATPALTKIRARKGDTISKIATSRKLDVNEVAKLNGLTPDTELRAGQEIRLPITAAAAPSRRR